MNNQIKKISLILLFGLLIFNSALPLSAQNFRQVSVDYLLQQSQDAWITQALAAAGQNNLSLGYLDNFNGQSVNDYAKAILAIAAVGQNPNQFNGRNFVESLSALANNNQLGSIDYVNDDMWGLMALRSAGVLADSQIAINSKNFILANQNEDGGWSYAPAQASDSNDTAAAIMALVSVGLTKDDQAIARAVTYLGSLQNDDAGFAYQAGSSSDSGSTAWVISALNSLGIAATGYVKQGHNPIEFLDSLALEDGSYKWQAGDNQGNLAMTVFVVVALAGKSYPVAYYQNNNGGNNQGDQGGHGQASNIHHLRIEGRNTTICDNDVTARTALEIIVNGASVCHYTYQIDQTGFGPYLSKINDEVSQGDLGWMYRVNWVSPDQGANDYVLRDGEKVLWAFSNWMDQPLKITLSSDHADLGQDITATVDYFDGQNWLPATGANVIAGDQSFSTAQNGQAVFRLNRNSSYYVYAEKEGYIRSPRLLLNVGNAQGDQANSLTLPLSVNILSSGVGNPGQQIAFTVDVANLDFGSLAPGQNSEKEVRISNIGAQAIYIEGTVSGDNIFSNNLLFNGQSWQDYGLQINQTQTQALKVKLNIPADYAASGRQQADLVFWAAAR